MDNKEVLKYAKEMIAKYPDLKRDITEIYSMAMDEISDGGSPENEWMLAHRDMKELVDNKTAKG